MCGRFTLRTSLNVLISEFQLDVSSAYHQLLLEPRYNIPPTVDIPVIRQAKTRYLSMMRWGLLPSWTKDPKKAPLLNNAHAETVTEKHSFRAAFENVEELSLFLNRCV